MPSPPTHAASPLTALQRLVLLAAALACLLPLGLRAEVTNWLGVFEDAERAALAERIQILEDQRFYDEAWALASSAVEANPESFEFARIFVEVAYRTNNFPAAHARFDRLLRAPATAAMGHFGRGWMAMLLGDRRSARSKIAKARELHTSPDFEIERAHLVSLRFMPGIKAERILAEYRIFIEKWSDVGLAHLSLINTYNFLDDGSREHLRAIEAAFAAPGTHPDVWLQKLSVLQRDSIWFDPREGIAMLDDAIAQYPGHPDLALRRIDYLRREGRHNEALDAVRAWRELAPNHGDFINVEVDVLQDLYRHDEAAEAAEALNDLPFQPQYRDGRPHLQAMVLHEAGRTDDAVKVLEEYLAENPRASDYNRLNGLLNKFIQREEGERVHLVDGLTLVEQVGNYCGPATVSMLLSRFGRNTDQHTIARNIYTGIAGTPPQVIHNYLHDVGLATAEFKGNDVVWKQLLDEGLPILWLRMLGRDGGHYILVVGYDDILGQWIVQNPHSPTRRRVMYGETDDRWFFPSLTRSIVAFPPERAAEPLLAGLRPTALLLISNWVLYVATGANVLTGFFPAIIVNLLAAGMLALLLAALLKVISYPARLVRPGLVIGTVLAGVLALNIVISATRWGGAVSILLGLHLSLVTLLPILGVVWILQRAIHDFVHPRESLGICIVATLGWLALAFVDTPPWEHVAPIAAFAIGLPIVLWPRIRIKHAEVASRYGDSTRALRIVRPMGQDGMQYFAATCIEMDALLSIGEYDRLVQLTERVLAAGQLPRANREAVELHRLIAIVLRNGEAAGLPLVEDFIARNQLSRAGLLVAHALELYHLAGVLGSDEPDARAMAERWPRARIDGVLDGLNKSAEKKLPGIPPTHTSRSYCILRAAALMGFRGALAEAVHSGDEARRQSLWRHFGQRHGLQFHLLRAIDHLDAPGGVPPYSDSDIVAKVSGGG